jgi:hypothetical protein
MWTIGRSQRDEGKKQRPIVCKIRYLVFVGEFKKNVTRQTWRALFHFGEYLFQSTHHFGECLKLEAQVSLYRSPDINKSSKECLHAEYI